MSTRPKIRLTPEEYLTIERAAETKSEYFDGEMFPLRVEGKARDLFAMVGASRRHNLIAGNVFGELRQQLKNSSCEAYTNDMRVKVAAAGLYTYPDVVVTCGEPSFEDEYFDTLLNPVLIVEVLSPSTAAYDRVKKFGYYRTIESLSEYLLIAQEEYRVEQYVRQSDGRWLLSDIRSPEAEFELPSVGCALRLADVYARVPLT